MEVASEFWGEEVEVKRVLPPFLGFLLNDEYPVRSSLIRDLLL